MRSSLLWLIPLLPFAGFLFNGLLSLGSSRSPRGPSRLLAALIGVAGPIAAFALTVAMAGRLSGMARHGGLAPAVETSAWPWFTSPGLDLALALRFDHLTSLMLLFITGIGALITIYSVGYMWRDRGFARFLAYMDLFLASMCLLVLGASLPIAFIGWEGVGLCSWLLIGFWHTAGANNDAARKAFVVNRVGDLGFLLGAFALFSLCGSLDFRTISLWCSDPAHAGLARSGLASAAALLILLGCTGKSAQIPLATWLPDAMAGPTPVSALIHAATMVTSGIYLIARLGDFFALAPYALAAVMLVGCATALWGAVAGLFQNDIKKVLAYSTVSQLGFMFMAAGAGAFDVALFHVFTHAFFKAALFLGAGAVIHALHHEQDLRRMGGLAKAKGMYLVHMAMCFAWWSILGLPGGAGFFSKDLILERLWTSGPLGMAVCVLAVATALLTAVYMSRLMYLAFWSPSRIAPAVEARRERVPLSMLLPVLLLGFGSLAAGIGMWVEWGPLTLRLFPDYLQPVLENAQFTAGAGPAPADPLASAAGPPVHPGHGLLVLAIAFVGSVAAIAGWLVARGLWGRGPTGPTVEERPSSDPQGFGAAWTWCFDRVYALIIAKPLAGLALVLYWGVEVLGLGLLTEGVKMMAVGIFGAGFQLPQRSRLRSNLGIALTALAVALILLAWRG